MKATDWDSYYLQPAAAAKWTRKISMARLLGTLAEPLKADQVRICELGGANSCFIAGFLEHKNIANYQAEDLNEYGLELLRKRYGTDARVSVVRGDALAAGVGETFDIVYSVGLIEHFDKVGTAKCVEGHFARCRPGGTVLITFPTPTAPYRAIRGAAEGLGMWKFPDERPLGFDEVVQAGTRFGPLLHRSINWMIGLTQGYVVFRKD
jgi:SAM-dependent methyltransferase